MSFEAIQCKQELREIVAELDEAETATQINEAFEQFINSIEFANFLDDEQRVAFKEKLDQLKIKLLNELTINTMQVKDIWQQIANDTLNISKSQPIHFDTLEELENISATLDTNLAGAFQNFFAGVYQPLNKFDVFEENRLGLIVACEDLSNHQQELEDFIRKIKNMTNAEITDFNSTRDLAAHLYALETLKQLKSLAETFEQDTLPFPEKMTRLQDYLAYRWQNIRNTSKDYCVAPTSKLSKLFVELATALSNVSPDDGRFSLLMPTVKTLKSDVTYTYFDNPELRLEHIILSEDNARFIEIQPCFVGAEYDGKFRNTTLVNGVITELSNKEKDHLQNHSPLSYQYAKAIAELREFNTNPQSMGARLQKLAERLLGGGVHHVVAGTPNDHRRADHRNAGESANLGILEFSAYLELLTEAEKTKLFALSAPGLSENFGQIWYRLATPDVVDLSDSHYCVELLAPQIKIILSHNPDVYTLGNLNIEMFEIPLQDAKTKFLNSFNSDNYQPNYVPGSREDITLERVLLLGKDFFDYFTAEDLLKLNDRYFSNITYENPQEFNKINYSQLQFLKLCVESPAGNLTLRIRYYEKWLYCLFMPLQNFVGSIVFNNKWYDRFYPYKFDVMLDGDYFVNVPPRFNRYYINPNNLNITRILCTIVYTVLTIVPYLLAQALTILGNILTGNHWNYSPYYWDNDREYRNLNDLRIPGYFLMLAANGLTYPITKGIAVLSSIAGLTAFGVIAALQTAALPVIAIVATVRQGLKVLADAVSNLFSKTASPVPKVTDASPKVVGNQQFIQKQLATRKSAQIHVDNTFSKGRLENDETEKTKKVSKGKFWEATANASANKESAAETAKTQPKRD